MKVEVKQADGSTLIGKGESGHWIVMDAPREFGGHEAGCKPMELMLLSLAGCTAIDIISLLNKMKVDFNDLQVKVSADRAPEHPKVFSSIKLEYYIFGKNLDEKKIEKAIRLSQEKYCSISAMLKHSVPMTYTYKLIQDKT